MCVRRNTRIFRITLWDSAVKCRTQFRDSKVAKVAKLQKLRKCVERACSWNEHNQEFGLWAQVSLTKCVLPTLKAKRSGKIVNIVSLGAKLGMPCRTSYCAAKAALASFFTALRFELIKDNVQVTQVRCVCRRLHAQVVVGIWSSKTLVFGGRSPILGDWKMQIIGIAGCTGDHDLFLFPLVFVWC